MTDPLAIAHEVLAEMEEGCPDPRAKALAAEVVRLRSRVTYLDNAIAVRRTAADRAEALTCSEPVAAPARARRKRPSAEGTAAIPVQTMADVQDGGGA